MQISSSLITETNSVALEAAEDKATVAEIKNAAAVEPTIVVKVRIP